MIVFDALFLRLIDFCAGSIVGGFFTAWYVFRQIEKRFAEKTPKPKTLDIK